MPTRRELLEDLNDNVEGLSGEILDSAEAYSNSADRIAETTETFELAINGMRVAMDDAAEKHGRSIKRAASDIEGGLFVSGVLHLLGAVFGAAAQAAPLIRENNIEAAQRVQIIGSVLDLINAQGPLDYEYLVKRSYAQDTRKGDRRTLINGLIWEGILYEEEVDGVMLVHVADDSDALEAHWDWLDEMEATFDETETGG